MMKRFIFSALLLGLVACGYQRLDRRPRAAAWMVKGETIRIDAAYVAERVGKLAGDTDLSRFVL